VSDLDVTWLLPDGAGGGRVPGGTARIPGTIPGDRVRFREVGRRGRTVQGVLEEVLVPSPDRRPPPCPWDAACGGCDLSAFASEPRRAALSGIVQRAFRLDALPPVHASPRADYRARIKLAVQEGRVGYRAAGTHDLVEVGTCGIARPEVREALTHLRAWAAEHAEAPVRAAEIRSDETRAVFALQGAGRGADLAEADAAALGAVALDGRVLHGDPTLHLHVGDLVLRASPNAFYQVNLEVNAALVGHVTARVAEVEPQRVLDLYAGIGNLGLPLARLAPVVAVEIEGQATADLRANAEAAALPVEVRTAPVERFDPAQVAFDVAVLDPPRSGAPGVLDRLLLNRPRAIVYVACNPPVAARDCRAALKAGYRVTDVTCFEMFPDTHHVEAVVVLQR